MRNMIIQLGVFTNGLVDIMHYIWRSFKHSSHSPSAVCSSVSRGVFCPSVIFVLFLFFVLFSFENTDGRVCRRSLG